MAKICEITGKQVRAGNNVSHAHNKTKRRFYPNLQIKKFYVPAEDVWVQLKVATAVIRTINKQGIEQVLRKAKKRGTLAKNYGPCPLIIQPSIFQK